MVESPNWIPGDGSRLYYHVLRFQEMSVYSFNWVIDQFYRHIFNDMVRCPECKAKWIWMAASKRDIIIKWGKGVLLLTECPECKDEKRLNLGEEKCKQ